MQMPGGRAAPPPHITWPLAARTRWNTNIDPWAMASARSCSGRGAPTWPGTPAPRPRVCQRRMLDLGKEKSHQVGASARQTNE